MEAQSALASLQEIDANVSGDQSSVDGIARTVSVLGSEIDARIAEDTRLLTTSPSLDVLYRLKLTWQILTFVCQYSTANDRPQWYNELLSNCTSNVRLHIKHIGSAHPWDWQLLLNGFIAERAYELRAIDTSLPFAELRRLSYIDYRARDADDDPRSRTSSGKAFQGYLEFRISNPRSRRSNDAIARFWW